MIDRVTIRQADPAGGSVVFELIGDDTLDGGVGGWETLERPRRTAAVEWVGTPAMTLALPLQLDGLETGGIGVDVPVEGQCNQVLTWGRAVGLQAPPRLQVTGPVQSAPATRWVITDLSWGPALRNDGGLRIRQDITVTLQEYLAPNLVESHAARVRIRRDKKKGKTNDKSPTKGGGEGKGIS